MVNQKRCSCQPLSSLIRCSPGVESSTNPSAARSSSSSPSSGTFGDEHLLAANGRDNRSAERTRLSYRVAVSAGSELGNDETTTNSLGSRAAQGSRYSG